MKTREEYLAMTPKHLSIERWHKKVNDVFDSWDFAGDEVDERRLNYLLNVKPRTLVERWIEEGKEFEKYAEDRKKKGLEILI